MYKSLKNNFHSLEGATKSDWLISEEEFDNLNVAIKLALPFTVSITSPAILLLVGVLLWGFVSGVLLVGLLLVGLLLWGCCFGGVVVGMLLWEFCW